MYVELIPLFLAANVSVDNSERWIYGPEFVFHGDIRIQVEDKVRDTFTTSIPYTLKCRNKDAQVNLCQISNISTERLNGRDHAGLNDMAEQLALTPFEINFNENTVESLTIPDGNFTDTVRPLAFIALLFSVGTDLKQRTTTPQFTAIEKSILGNCDTVYKISVNPIDESSEETSHVKNNYDLFVTPYANLKSNMKFEIKKIRNIDSCEFYVQNDNKVENNDPLELASYNNKIVVTNRGFFESESEFTHLIKIRNGPRRYTGVYRIGFSARLVGIEKANGPLTPIDHPKTIDISTQNGSEAN